MADAVDDRRQRSKLDLTIEITGLFRQLGYAGTTMSGVTQVTGLGRSSLYHHFGGGKRQMADYALDLVDDFIRRMADVVAEEADPRDAWSAIERMLRDHYRDGRLGCLLAVFALEEVPAELRNRTRLLLVAWTTVMADLHRRSGRNMTQALDLARSDLIAIQGSLILSRGLSDEEPFDRAIDGLGMQSG